MMRPGFPGQFARSVCLWACLVIMLALMAGGCQSKAAPLSKNAEALKQQLLREMNTLTAALVAPVAKQDWQAVESILPAKMAELKKRGDVTPANIVVVDKNAISQARFPAGEAHQGLDFMNYQPAQVVFTEKKKTQAQLFHRRQKDLCLHSPDPPAGPGHRRGGDGVSGRGPEDLEGVGAGIP